MPKQLLSYRLFAIIFILLMAGCQTPQHTETAKQTEFSGYSPAPSKALMQNWYQLIGSWQGEYALNDNASYRWTITHTRDGKFEGTSTWYTNAKLVKQIHFAGVWGVDKDYYFNITNQIIEDGNVLELDLAGPYNHQLYRIIELNNTAFIYEHTDSGLRFNSKKIPAPQNQYE